MSKNSTQQRYQALKNWLKSLPDKPKKKLPIPDLPIELTREQVLYNKHKDEDRQSDYPGRNGTPFTVSLSR